MVLRAAIDLRTGEPYRVAWVLPGRGLGVPSHWFSVLGPGAGASAT